MKSGERHLTDRTTKNKVRTLGEKETYKYLGILEADTIKQVEMKENIKKTSLRRTRRLLETKLCCRNLIKGINTWAVPLVRYSGPFLKWTREELKQENKWQCIRHYIPETMLTNYMNQERRVEEDLPALNTALTHPYNDSDYIEKHDGGLITATRNDTDNTMDNRMRITWKQKWEERQLYGVLTPITRGYNNQQKKLNLQNCGLCCSGWPQNKTEGKWKVGYATKQRHKN